MNNVQNPICLFKGFVFLSVLRLKRKERLRSNVEIHWMTSILIWWKNNVCTTKQLKNSQRLVSASYELAEYPLYIPEYMQLTWYTVHYIELTVEDNWDTMSTKLFATNNKEHVVEILVAVVVSDNFDLFFQECRKNEILLSKLKNLKLQWQVFTIVIEVTL